ncbi:MAG: hypothetical protein R3212_03270 [Xanthomonadales bacterium]|nr:hypothetical protein [Xanthomonadales bacterium]
MSSPESISHAQAFELLPWLVNGSIDDDEHRAVREHAHACVICRRELKALELLGGYIQDSADTQHIPAPDMRNINARIDAEVKRQTRGRILFSRIRESLSDPWRLAFALQTVLVLVLATALLWPQSPEPEFTTLTQPQAIADGPQIRVVFHPDLSVFELATLLDTMGLSVAYGPSARGVYTLNVAAGISDDERVRLFEGLQGDPNVQFAQWVARPGD